MAAKKRVPERTFYATDPEALITFVKAITPRNEARSYAHVWSRGVHAGRLAFPGRRDAVLFARVLGLYEHDGAGTGKGS